jgi:hypothetical protein
MSAARQLSSEAAIAGCICDYWSEPVNDLGWEKLVIRKLIESLCIARRCAAPDDAIRTRGRDRCRRCLTASEKAGPVSRPSHRKWERAGPVARPSSFAASIGVDRETSGVSNFAHTAWVNERILPESPKREWRGAMQNSGRCRSNAAECLLAAQEAYQPYYRKLHLSMAVSWLSLARQYEARGNPLASWDTPWSGKSRQRDGPAPGG